MLKYSIVYNLLNFLPILIKFVSKFIVCKVLYFKAQYLLRLRSPLRVSQTFDGLVQNTSVASICLQKMLSFATDGIATFLGEVTMSNSLTPLLKEIYPKNIEVLLSEYIPFQKRLPCKMMAKSQAYRFPLNIILFVTGTQRAYAVNTTSPQRYIDV